MTLKSTIKKILDDEEDKPKIIDDEYIVNSKSIKHLNLKKLGKSPTMKNVIFVSPESISIGDNVGLNYNVWLNGAGGIEIGNDVIVGPFTVIHSANHKFEDTQRLIRTQGHTFEKVVIEDDVWIGAHCVIRPGAHIEKGCVIGARSIITKRIPRFSVVIENNKIIRKRE
jgi:acetyltransferase-like isoleucine patch superfamily enzyme